MGLHARTNHVSRTHRTWILAVLAVITVFTRLITSGSCEAKFTNAGASFGVASVVVMKVTVTDVVTMNAEPSTRAFILALVTFIPRGTIALASEATTVCSITTNALSCAVHSKKPLRTRKVTVLAFEPGSADARAVHVIAHSTVLAEAISEAAVTERSLGANTLAEDSRVSICATTRSSSPVTRYRIRSNTLARAVAVDTITIRRACVLTVFTVVARFAGARSIGEITSVTVLTLATLAAVFAKVAFRALLFALEALISRSAMTHACHRITRSNLCVISTAKALRSTEHPIITDWATIRAVQTRPSR